jgi:threonine dehydrogenase-like Zn-dependent dehydrogenase
MHAVTWHGVEDVRVESVDDPRIEQPNDAIVRLTSTAICGSDLHLYKLLGMYMKRGDILGHEGMGVVDEVGPNAGSLRPGDRVVIPFNIACGHCPACRRGLMSQCDTTQVTEHGKGARLLGYSALYGQVPGAQAEYVRVPEAQFGPMVVPDDGQPDERYLYLSDILPTAWQAVAYADIHPDETVAVWGLGPVGQFCARIARLRGASRVFGIDRVPERLDLARRHGAETIDGASTDVVSALRDATGGRGPDSVIDAVGMEAHGSLAAATAQRAVGLLPDRIARPLVEHAGVDQMSVFYECIDAVRRGGTVSVTGVYGGAVDPVPMMTLFDKQLTIRMGQANVRRWTDDLMPLVSAVDDPLGVLDLATHRLPLAEAPKAYEIFQRKADGCVKVVLEP